MFGLNWGELVVIGIVALIAIGPKELPSVLRTIGQWTGRVRRMANEFQGQFQEALREAELHDLQKQADDISSSVKSLASIDPLAEEQKEIERIGESAAAPPIEQGTGSVDAPAAETLSSTEIPLPMPEMPPPVNEKDFAPAATEPAKDIAAEPQKQAGGGT